MKRKIIGLATNGTQMVYEDGEIKFINPETDKEIYKVEPAPQQDKGLKYDSDKLRLNLITEPMLTGLGEVLTFGANKYEANSWQNVPDAIERYKAALLRHYTAWIGGEDLDAESKLHHVKHILCNAAFLVQLIEEKDGRDS